MASIKRIEKVTLLDFMRDYNLYKDLPDSLLKLPVPNELTIGKKQYKVPGSMDEFTSNICYGQKIYLTREDRNDVDVILRLISGYYYPIITSEKWDELGVDKIKKIVLTCKIIELYPVSMQITRNIEQTNKREQELLYREPSKLEKAAGINRLNAFSEISAIDFLRDSMKVTVEEVMLTPYNECLVRFMMQKELNDYQERYLKLSREISMAETHKSKFEKK